MESNDKLQVEADLRVCPIIYELAKAYKQWKCVQTGCNPSVRVIESIATIEKTAVFCNDCDKQLTEIQTEL